MGKAKGHDEERWEANGKEPAQRIDDPTPTLFAHIGVIMVTTVFGVLLVGLMILVGIDKMTVPELIEMTKLLLAVFVLAVGGLVGTRVVHAVRNAARKELNR